MNRVALRHPVHVFQGYADEESAALTCISLGNGGDLS